MGSAQAGRSMAVAGRAAFLGSRLWNSGKHVCKLHCKMFNKRTGSSVLLLFSEFALTSHLFLGLRVRLVRMNRNWCELPTHGQKPFPYGRGSLGVFESSIA